MDINTPIEITENSTGLDLLNETRRAFSVYFWQEMQKVHSIPVVDDKQARMLSQHLGQRLGVMRVLTIIGDDEISQATDHLHRMFNADEELAAIVFAPVNDSIYSQYSANEMLFLWNTILQQFFTRCLTAAAQQSNTDERTRLYAFAENAISCCSALHMMKPDEITKALEILKEFRAGNTNVSTKYTNVDMPDLT